MSNSPGDGYQGEYIRDIAQKYLDKESFTAFDGEPIHSSGNIDDLENIRKYAVAYLRNEQYNDLQAFGVSFDNYFLESSLYRDGEFRTRLQPSIKPASFTRKTVHCGLNPQISAMIRTVS